MFTRKVKFDDITDLELFSKELMYYIAHLDIIFSQEAEYKLVININNKWVEINLKEGCYNII